MPVCWQWSGRRAAIAHCGRYYAKHPSRPMALLRCTRDCRRRCLPLVLAKLSTSSGPPMCSSFALPGRTLVAYRNTVLGLDRYNLLKQHVQGGKKRALSTGTSLAIAYAAGAINATLTSPMWTVATRLKLSARHSAAAGDGGTAEDGKADQDTGVPQPHVYSGSTLGGSRVAGVRCHARVH